MRYPVPEDVTEALDWLRENAKFNKETWKYEYYQYKKSRY